MAHRPAFSVGLLAELVWREPEGNRRLRAGIIPLRNELRSEHESATRCFVFGHRLRRLTAFVRTPGSRSIEDVAQPGLAPVAAVSLAEV